MSLPNIIMAKKTFSRRDRTKILRLIATIRDFTYAKNAAHHFYSTNNLDLKHHLFTSFIIAYTRPFTCNDGLGSICEDYPEYKSNFKGQRDAKLHAQHDRMWKIRNSFIAHGEVVRLKAYLIPPNVPSPISQRRMPYAEFAVATREFLHPEFLRWLLEAVITLEKRVNHDLQLFLRKHAVGNELIELETGADLFDWKT